MALHSQHRRPSRSCPVCGHPVPWQRYWLVSWRSKWPCTGCGSLLTIDPSRGGMLALLAGLVGAGTIIVRDALGWPIAVVAVACAAIVLRLLQRVTVVARLNRSFCARCRYDLTGTLQAGIERCPECGTPTEPALDASALADLAGDTDEPGEGGR